MVIFIKTKRKNNYLTKKDYMKFFNQFETQAKYDSYFKSENYTEPHLALIEETGKLYYKKETPLQLSYNAVEKNMRFINTPNNLKTIKVDDYTHSFEPIHTFDKTFIVDSEKIEFKDDGTCNAPQEYFKYKDVDTVILKPYLGENIKGFDGFVSIQNENSTYTYQLIPFSLFDDEGADFTFDAENNTFSTSDTWTFISNFNNYNLILYKGDEDNFTCYTTETTLIGKTGGFKISQFGSLGLHNVEMTLIKPIINNGMFRSTCLTEVIIPTIITNIENYAFWDCTSLSVITSMSNTAPLLDGNPFYSVSDNGTLNVPKNSDYSTWLEKLPKGWVINWF